MSNNKMLIDASHPEETRVAIVRGNRVDEFDFESEHKTQIRGNIYLAKVTRVEPSLQAAFVDYGGNRHGFLAFSEIHPDYYQIPVADREALIAAEAEDALQAAQDDVEEDDEDAAEANAASDSDDDDSEEAPVSAKPKRRRRSRRRGSKADASAEAAEDAGDTDAPADEDTTKDDVSDDADSGEESDDSDDVISAENDSDDVVSEPVSDPVASNTPDAEAEEKPKKKRAPRRKAAAKKEPKADEETAEAAASEEAPAADEAEAAPEKPKRRRTSRKKVEAEATEEPVASEAAPEADKPAEAPEEPVVAAADEETKPKRRRSRRKPAAKQDAEDEAVADASADAETASDAEAEKPADGEDEDSGNGRKRRRRTRGRGRSRDADADTSNDDDDDKPVESVGADDALEEVPVRRTSRRHYKIQEVIKRRQILLVQVVKEERGNKGAALTTYLSLAGRYSVLMPNTARGGGISRKITNMADRKRMKGIASGFDVPKGMGVILRTAGASQTPQEIQRDFEYLMRLWENVRTLTLESTAPCLVYEEGSLIKRSIRDLYHKDTGEVLVSGVDGYKEARDFMAMLMPGHEKSVRQYKDRVPLFSRMGVEDQLDAMLQPQVTLKSGGYLIIDQTEALVAIDVNSGRSTRQHSVEDTATQTNLEAADEVARQLRLRDLAGLIVIDFIDMDDRRNVRNVEKRLKDALKNDRARIQVGRISHFGLMEMSRQRIRASVLESTTQTCPTCGGVGHVKSGSSVALSVLRDIEEQLNKNARNNLNVRVTTSTALYMLNTKRDNLSDLENRFGVLINIDTDDSIAPKLCVIDRGEIAKRRSTTDGPVQVDTIDPDRSEDVAEAAPVETPKPAEEERKSTQSRSDEQEASEGDGENRPKRRRRRRKSRSDSDSDETSETATAESTEESATAEAPAEPRQEEPAKAPVEAAAPVSDDKDEEEATDTRRSRTRRPRKPKPVEAVVESAEAEPEAALVEEAVAVEASTDDTPAEPPRPPRRNTRRVTKAEAAAAAAEEEALSEPATEAAPEPEPKPEAQAASTDETAEDGDKKGWWQRKFF